MNSIALVPDQISQSVYVKQASSQFDIAERTLISELNKIKRTKFKKERKEGGYNDEDTLDLITPPDQLPEKAAVGENLDSQELDLLRLMLLYGTYGVEIEVEDSNEQVKKLEVPVVQFILDELAADGIILTNEIANEMIDEFNKAADSGIIPDIKHFVNHQNQKINSLAVDLTAEKYIVSENWAKMHNIYPETEEMKLQRAVEEAVWIYKLRRVRLMKSDLEIRLKNNLPESEQSVVMKDIIKYNEIITVISNKLDIVVAK